MLRQATPGAESTLPLAILWQSECRKQHLSMLRKVGAHPLLWFQLLRRLRNHCNLQALADGRWDDVLRPTRLPDCPAEISQNPPGKSSPQSWAQEDCKELQEQGGAS